MNPFHGQYLRRAETTRITPINPTHNQKIPEMKKARMIKIPPVIDRKSPSLFPTFFTFTADFPS
jgi:hypothetical protein